MFHPEIKSLPNEDISILLKLDNHAWNYICDCGDASLLTVKDCQNTAAIFISHTHIDHFINFDTIIRHQLGIQRKVVICGPLGIAKQVQAKILGYTWNLIEPNSISYEIREIIAADTIKIYELKPPEWELKLLQESSAMLFEQAAFKVSFTILDHKTPSIAYLFQEKEVVKIDLSNSQFKGGKWVKELKTAFEVNNPNQLISIETNTFKAEELFHLLHIKKGHSVGIIMDHAANESNHNKIKTLFNHCDKVFIECYYQTKDKAYATQNSHSYAEKSGQIMHAAKVKEAIPVHFSRKYTAEEIIDIVEDFNAAYAGNLSPLPLSPNPVDFSQKAKDKLQNP